MVHALQVSTISAILAIWILYCKYSTHFLNITINTMRKECSILKLVRKYQATVFIARLAKYFVVLILVYTLKSWIKLCLSMKLRLKKSIKKVLNLLILKFWLLKIIKNSVVVANKMLSNTCNGFLIDWTKRSNILDIVLLKISISNLSTD